MHNNSADLEESEDDLVLVEQEEKEPEVEVVEEEESSVSERQVDFQTEVSNYDDVVMPSEVSEPHSSPTVPYSESFHAPEAESLSPDQDNDADSESSDIDTSTSNTPPPRRSGRATVPKLVFTYNEFGNPTIELLNGKF